MELRTNLFVLIFSITRIKYVATLFTQLTTMKKFFFLLSYLFLFHAPMLFAWGFEAHREINKRAIIFLPAPLIRYYKSYKDFIVAHAVDADKRKHFQKQEPPRHYINLDACDEPPFHHIPRAYKNALAKYGKDSLERIGILPFHIERMCENLTRAFQEKNGDQILKLSADLGHYIGDAAVPLHITKNYNGQLSNQEGIHGLWETQAVKLLHIDTLTIKLKPVVFIPHIKDEVWSMILTSFSHVGEVLNNEKKISASWGEENKYHIKVKKGKVTKTFTHGFVEQFLALSENRIRERLFDASYLLACLYYTCWVNANKPNPESIQTKKIPKSKDDNEEDEEHKH